jgi:hypothetical protein
MNNINIQTHRTYANQHNQPVFKIHSWNCQGSSSNKITQIRNHLHKFKPQILCLQETKIKQKLNLSMYNIQGYSFTATPHKSGNGGLGIYIRDDVKYKHRPDLINETVIDNCENANNIMWHEFLSNGELILLGNTYINPSNNAADTSNLLKMILTIKSQSKPFIIIGDMNAKHDNWNHVTQSNNIGDQLKQFIHQYSLLLLNNEYCKYEPTMLLTQSTIDLAITIDDHIVGDMKVITNDMISDHYPIQITLASSTNITQPATIHQPHMKWDTHPKFKSTKPHEMKAEMDLKWQPFTEQLNICLGPLQIEWKRKYDQLIHQHHILLQHELQTPDDTVINQNVINELWLQLSEIIKLTCKTTIGEKKVDNKYKHWFTDPRIQTMLKQLRKSKRTYFKHRTNKNKFQLFKTKQQWYELEAEVRKENFTKFCSTLNKNKKIHWNTWNRNKPTTFTPLTSICDLQTGQ